MKANISLLGLDEIVVLLKDRKLSVVARKTGVPYGNLRNIAVGVSKNPNYRDMDALREYFS